MSDGMESSSKRAKWTHRVVIKRLPSWFKLDNYRATATLNALGWWRQIYIRRTCYDYIFGVGKGLYAVGTLPEWDQAVEAALAQSRSRPVCDSSSYPFNTKPFSGLSMPREAAAVRRTTLKDVCRIRMNVLRRLSPEQLREMHSYEDSELPFRFYRRTDWESIPADDHLPRRAAIIDLSYPNPTLKKQFARLLQTLRPEPGGWPNQASSHRPDFKFWAAHGLLPCMDLLLWADEQGNRISHSFLASAVNPGAWDTNDQNLPEIEEDTIRKTIRPLAEELLRGQANLGTSFERLQHLISELKPPRGRRSGDTT